MKSGKDRKHVIHLEETSTIKRARSAWMKCLVMNVVPLTWHNKSFDGFSLLYLQLFTDCVFSFCTTDIHTIAVCRSERPAARLEPPQWNSMQSFALKILWTLLISETKTIPCIFFDLVKGEGHIPLSVRLLEGQWKGICFSFSGMLWILYWNYI